MTVGVPKECFVKNEGLYRNIKKKLMESDYLYYCVGAVLLSCLLAGILIPQILLISFRKKLFDVSDERKIHSSTVPRLGGIAFGPVILFSVMFILALNMLLNKVHIISVSEQDSIQMSLFICSGILLYLVGIADDLIGVRYRAKFIVQIVCGIMFVASGLWFSDLFGLLGISGMPVYVGYPLTVLMVVFFINSINLIDGIDGLASGLTAVALLVYGFVFLKVGDFIFALIAFSAFGVLLPFFYYNVFGNVQKRKKIFMGDTGSLTIGIIVSAMTLRLMSADEGLAEMDINPVIVAFTPLIVPSFDVFRVVMLRFRNHTNLFLPDKNHIHHKLLAAGMNQHSALISIVSFSLLLTLSNIALDSYVNINILLVADVLIFTIANIIISKFILKRKTSQNKL
ncbi:MAG: MraY family glycosyltransferase [Candidatus Limisoma sp.]|nr:MraY family glycosyltransferase [Candidatus Limisoma sp.]